MSISRKSFLKTIGVISITTALPAEFHGSNGNFNVTNTRSSFHRVLSCNIRVALDEDEKKGVGWSSRKDVCLKIIKNHKPDIISLQEVLKVQADDFRKYFSKFQLVGFDGPEMDANPTGYHGIAKNPVLFSKQRYELLAAGTYWLSETPLAAGSKSWDTARARHANWIRIKDKNTGKELRVLNLHLDHVSAKAKLQQAKMVVEESSQYQPEFSQIITGDFNTNYSSEILLPLRHNSWKEGYETIHGEKEAGFTGHAFLGVNNKGGSPKGRIDFIWYKGKLNVQGALIIKDDIGGKYPSDHFFIQSDFVTI